MNVFIFWPISTVHVYFKNFTILDHCFFLQAKVDFPVSVTCVAGTQAGKVTANNIVVFRMSNLHTVRPTGILS
jgi:hypothetical protein